MLKRGDLKVELQIRGVSINRDMYKELVEKYNVPHLQYNKILLYFVDKNSEQHPVYTYINSENSLFSLSKDRENKLFISNGQEKIDVRISPKPKYYEMEINNKKCYEIANIEADGHLAVTIDHSCIHFINKKQCKFCSINSWTDNRKNTQEELLKVIKIAYDMNLIKHISITTGTINTKDKGIKGILNFIEKLDMYGIYVPIACEFEPVDDLEWIKKLHEYSVRTISCNIEIVEEIVRRRIMPGKGCIPKEIYYKNWLKAVELFGENQVYTNIILSKYNEDFNEIKRNLEFICKLGVIPSTGLIYPENNTELFGCDMPDENFIKEVHRNNIFNIIDNGLSPMVVAAGSPRNGAYSPIKEYFLDYK